jgi:hypothetical protein
MSICRNVWISQENAKARKETTRLSALIKWCQFSRIHMEVRIWLKITEMLVKLNLRDSRLSDRSTFSVKFSPYLKIKRLQRSAFYLRILQFNYCHMYHVYTTHPLQRQKFDTVRKLIAVCCENHTKHKHIVCTILWESHKTQTFCVGNTMRTTQNTNTLCAQYYENHTKHKHIVCTILWEPHKHIVCTMLWESHKTQTHCVHNTMRITQNTNTLCGQYYENHTKHKHIVWTILWESHKTQTHCVDNTMRITQNTNTLCGQYYENHTKHKHIVCTILIGYMFASQGRPLYPSSKRPSGFNVRDGTQQ